MSRLRTTLEYRRSDELVTYVVASPAATWFDGHFPDQPLLPGVAMLTLVEDTLCAFWREDGPVEVADFRRVRFRQRVPPGAGLRVRVQRPDGVRLRFAVELGGAPACTGECTVVPRICHHVEASAAERAWSTLGEPARRFAEDATLGDLAARASRLCELGAVPTLCVATADRVEVAAAMMAALAGGIRAIFPSVLTAPALAETHRACPFSWWLGPEGWAEALAETPAARVSFDAPTGTRRLDLDGSAAPCVFLQTSGSTGQPQLWPKTARNLLDEVAAQIQALRVEPDDRILATVPPHHIYGLLFSVLVPLCSGAQVARRSPFFPQEIAARVEAGATILVSTPAHLRVLATTLPRANRLRLVLSSGAPLPAADAAAFHARTGIWPLEVYGSTETGGIAVRRQDVADCAWSPLPDVEHRVQDEVLEVRSPYVSRVSGEAADAYFRTADLAETAADGRFVLWGRSDGIVKVGGQRVSLPAVEQALAALAEVTDAVVLALPSASGRGQEVVAMAASARSADELLRELRAILPSPAWPRRLRIVAAIPTTAAGKRDRSEILRLLAAGEGEASSA